MPSRREFLQTGAALLVAGRLDTVLRGHAAPIAITVYKSPTCGCCGKWVEHMKANGFAPTVHDMDDVTPMKHKLGVPDAMASCHTGVVGSYLVEGHVPADLVKRMLTEKPAFLGLAVPGMVTGSPGMEGSPVQKYDVIAFERGGKTRVYASR